jgi:hypothetical protein
MKKINQIMTKNQQEILGYLSNYRGENGIYIIRAKNKKVLSDICQKLNFEMSSDIAYVGKAKKTKSSDLFYRSKQEMGWSNFEGATFVRKIGMYLDFDIKDKTNKELQEKTREFISDNFTIECKIYSEDLNLLEIESQEICNLKPCLNVKKNCK